MYKSNKNKTKRFLSLNLFIGLLAMTTSSFKSYHRMQPTIRKSKDLLQTIDHIKKNKKLIPVQVEVISPPNNPKLDVTKRIGPVAWQQPAPMQAGRQAAPIQAVQQAGWQPIQAGWQPMPAGWQAVPWLAIAPTLPYRYTTIAPILPCPIINPLLDCPTFHYFQTAPIQGKPSSLSENKSDSESMFNCFINYFTSCCSGNEYEDENEDGDED